MSYVINYFGGTITIPVGTADTTATPLILVGRNWTSSDANAGYGQALNQNFVSLLQNFANPTQPTSPLKGQFWYDTSSAQIKINNGTPLAPAWSTIYNTGASIPNINNGASEVDIPVTNGNVNVSVGGSSNVFVVTSTGANVTGTLSATGNITGNNLSLTGNITGNNLSLTGNLTLPGGSTLAAVDVTASGNITAGNLTVLGRTTTTAISTSAVGVPGTITGTWTMSVGSTLQSTYADLAEYYTIDKSAGAATVVEFGGSAEIRVCQTQMSRAIAGVVSTTPAFIMNIENVNSRQIREAVALQGRVPCKVIGQVSKGDLMVSAGNGAAMRCDDPVIGSVIGKSLEDKVSGDLGIIEIAVGRL